MEAEKIISIGRIKSPFVSGGVAGDRIRNIVGDLGYIPFVNEDLQFTTSGILKNSTKENTWAGAMTIANQSWRQGTIRLDASLVVPTGSENSPVALSVKHWRRIN